MKGANNLPITKSNDYITLLVFYRYILLEDCGHFISKDEFSALISTTVGLFLCPICQKPQTSSHYIRYNYLFYYLLLQVDIIHGAAS